MKFEINKILNNFLLARDKFVDRLLNIMKGYKNLEKQVNQGIYIEMNQTKLVLFMMLLILIVKTFAKELFETKF